jgi:hypothetical protein
LVVTLQNDTNEVERIAKIIAKNVRPLTQAEFDAIIVRAGNAARVNGGVKIDDCPFDGRKGDLWKQGWGLMDRPYHWW